MTTLGDLAAMVRSRRVGQASIEIDVMVKTAEHFERLTAQKVVTRDVVAELYNADPSDVVLVEEIAEGQTIHVLLRRPSGRSSGDFGDTDVSGGLQYIPLSQLAVPGDWS